MSIVLTNLAKHYRVGGQEVHAVDHVSLTLAAGEFAALAGPSGSGKTTLLNLIGGLDRPDAGDVLIDGQSLAALSERALTDLRLRRIGFVFQSYNLVSVLSAFENVALTLQLQGVPPAEQARRVGPLLEALGLGGMAHRRPGTLSGGQQQRVAVARAVVGNPALVLADEPTANLDTDTARSLMDLMRRLNTERGITFLFSSHDPVVIESARRVIRLRDGRVQADEQRV